MPLDEQLVDFLPAQHPAGERIGGRAQAGDVHVEMALPCLGSLALGCLDNPADSPESDRHVGTRDVGPDPAVLLRVGEHNVDQ